MGTPPPASYLSLVGQKGGLTPLGPLHQENCWGRGTLILKGGDTPSASPGALTLEVRREYWIPWNWSRRWL